MECQYGEIDEQTKNLSLKFIKIDEKEFQEINLDVTGLNSKEEIIEKINELEVPEEIYAKINLTGYRRTEIEPLEIIKHIVVPNIIKIKDKTILEINLEKLSAQESLKGLFVKNLLEKLAQEPENKEKIEKEIEIGLTAFN